MGIYRGVVDPDFVVKLRTGGASTEADVTEDIAAVDELSGKQIFAIDVQLPDMLNAAIAQCPVFGGTLQSFDADKVKAMPGVRHVVAVGDEAEPAKRPARKRKTA